MMFAALTLLPPLSWTTALTIAAATLLVFVLLRWLCGPTATISRRWALWLLRAGTILTTVLILLNPTHVTQTPGPIDRPDVFFLLDSSQSMAVGDQETRFDHALRLMREAVAEADPDARAEIKLFRFGQRLTAVEDPSSLGLATGTVAALAPPSAGGDSTPSAQRAGPVETDTQLLTALRQVSSRFGRRPPASIVLFSDGRARDDSAVEQLSEQFAQLKIPVHVVPVGDTARGGDVSIVACVMPARVRRFTEVEVQVFLRSYGYEGRRCEVRLSNPEAGDPSTGNLLAPAAPVTLHDGFQSVGLTFRSEAKGQPIQVAVSPLPDEVSTANNVFQTEIAIDRTKIRVLYIEGSAQPLQPVQRGDRYELRGPYTDLQQALVEDEDIECVVLHAAYGRTRLSRVVEAGSVNSARGFPESVAELAAFDALILSDVGANSFTDEQLQWIEQWVGQRGAGLLMVGGPRSFAAGGWNDSLLAQMLPVEMRDNGDWLPGTQVSVIAEPGELTHPLWAMTSDARLNSEIVGSFPSFFGANRWDGVKPNFTTVLASSNLAASEPPAVARAAPAATSGSSLLNQLRRNLIGQKRPGVASGQAPSTTATTEPGAKLDPNAANQPAIVAGRYGRGRSMALAMPITSPWANDFLTKWGQGDTRYFGKFWRNAVYWLTESSSIGRRRLIVSADKKFYRPGDVISLTASAFDESANQTAAYRISGLIEPQATLNQLESNYSPIRWPEGRPRESGEVGPFIAWGEEFDLPREDAVTGKPAFALQLPIADALSVGSASQSLRVELTAMEEYTQVDSTSLDVQILHDPFEQQNPFPNHQLLEDVARYSGGRVLQDKDQLAEVLEDVTLQPGVPVVKKSPVWSNWWLWSWLVGLLSTEWIVRRFVGLA